MDGLTEVPVRWCWISQLDGVGFPSGTSPDCVSCFLSKGRKSPTSGFSWTGWVIHFVLHCPFLRLQLGSLNRKLSQTDWTLGKPFYDPEYALHTVFVSLPGAQTSWAPSPLPASLTSTVFPCMPGILEIAGALPGNSRDSGKQGWDSVFFLIGRICCRTPLCYARTLFTSHFARAHLRLWLLQSLKQMFPAQILLCKNPRE